MKITKDTENKNILRICKDLGLARISKHQYRTKNGTRIDLSASGDTKLQVLANIGQQLLTKQ